MCDQPRAEGPKPLEFARWLKQHHCEMKFGPRIPRIPENYWTLHEIANHIGRAASWLHDILSLLDLPPGYVSEESSYLEAMQALIQYRKDQRESRRINRMMRV